MVKEVRTPSKASRTSAKLKIKKTYNIMSTQAPIDLHDCR